MQIEAAAAVRFLFFGFTSGLGLALGMELGRVAKEEWEGLWQAGYACLLAAACDDIMKMKLV